MVPKSFFARGLDPRLTEGFVDMELALPFELPRGQRTPNAGAAKPAGAGINVTPNPPAACERGSDLLDRVAGAATARCAPTAADAGRCLDSSPAGRGGGASGTVRRRQIHHHQPVDAPTGGL